MSGVTDFQIVKGASVDDLAAKVAAAISDGWQPYFGTLGSPDGSFSQPMTKGAIILVGDTGAAGADGADGAVKTFYGHTTSAANTYAVTITGATLADGNIFAIKFDHAPTGAATLNVNTLGAKPIVLATGAAISGPQGSDGQIATMVYDGTSFVYIVAPNNVV